MRRHETLIPLTHDHHHVLKQVRKLRSASDGDDDVRIATAREFLSFFDTEGITHFRQEEELIFPFAVDEPTAEEPLARAMSDHLRLHALTRDLKKRLREGSPSGAMLAHIADTLEEHVRLEEKVLFPLIEALIPEDDDLGVTRSG